MSDAASRPKSQSIQHKVVMPIKETAFQAFLEQQRGASRHVATKTQSSNSRQGKGEGVGAQRQDIEHYFRRTLNMNKDKRPLRRGSEPGEGSSGLDPRTKMYWKLRKQVAKDSEIYGPERISDYAQTFDAKTKGEAAPIGNRISQKAVEAASQAPERGRANSRMSAKELEDDLKSRERERRTSSMRFITVVNEERVLASTDGLEGKALGPLEQSDLRPRSELTSLPRISALRTSSVDVADGSQQVSGYSKKRASSIEAGERPTPPREQLQLESLRAKSILTRKRLDLRQRPEKAYASIGTDIELPRQAQIAKGRSEIRGARERTTRPDGSRHLQKAVLRHKIWQYKPEHYEVAEEVRAPPKPQDHRQQFTRVFEALQ